MRIRFFMISCLTLGVLTPAAVASQVKPHPVGQHPVGVHPKPNHRVAKFKFKKPKKV